MIHCWHVLHLKVGKLIASHMSNYRCPPQITLINIYRLLDIATRTNQLHLPA